MYQQQHIDKMISALHHARVTSVSYHRSDSQVWLRCDSCTVRANAEWSYHDESGSQRDASCSLEERQAFHLWQTIGKLVTCVEITEGPTNNLQLTFCDYRKLVIYGDTGGYEDWEVASKDFWIMCNGTI